MKDIYEKYQGLSHTKIYIQNNKDFEIYEHNT